MLLGELLSPLATLGIKPADIGSIAISRFHPDHTGNVDEFPDGTVIMQQTEWDFAMALPQPPFSALHKHRLIHGDVDLFGDGSLTLLSTPGHTPGHQSLLVRLNRCLPVRDAVEA